MPSKRKAETATAATGNTKKARVAAGAAAQKKTPTAATGNTKKERVAAGAATQKEAPVKASTKRKADTVEAAVTKKTRVEPKKADTKPTAEASQPKAKAAPKARSVPSAITKKLLAPKKALPIVNQTCYDDILEVLVCGEGSSGELGLGSKAKDVKRPRLNNKLDNVVALAAGGMHVLALTKENQILSWGVNDQFALGRITVGGEKLVDMKTGDDSDSQSDDGDMNPAEANPIAIPSDSFPEDTKIVELAAGDSCSFALTDTGRVWGWGTFRSNDGILGFSRGVETQKKPILNEDLKNITSIKCGSNHVLALDKAGQIWAFGAGQQHQLARTVVARNEINATRPSKVVLKHGRRTYKAKDIACGAYHSFAIDEQDRVWSWGLNNYGQCGFGQIEEESQMVIKTPTLVDSLNIPELMPLRKLICGGHHTLAISASGDVYSFGRCDAGQLGLDLPNGVAKEDLAYSVGEDGEIVYSRLKAIRAPYKIPGVNDAVTGAAGPEHSIILTSEGKAYACGFSCNYQTGLGTEEDVKVPTLIDNSAAREREFSWVGTGGQYSIFSAKA